MDVVENSISGLCLKLGRYPFLVILKYVHQEEQLPLGNLTYIAIAVWEITAFDREILCFQGPSFTITEPMPEGNPLNKVAKIDDNLAQWQNPSEKKSLVKSYSAIVVS